MSTAREPWFRDRAEAIKAVQGVLDLMMTASTFDVATDAIVPNGNGYACWFTDTDITHTAPLSAEQIVDRIEAANSHARPE